MLPPSGLFTDQNQGGWTALGTLGRSRTDLPEWTPATPPSRLILTVTGSRAGAGNPGSWSSVSKARPVLLAYRHCP